MSPGGEGCVKVTCYNMFLPCRDLYSTTIFGVCVIITNECIPLHDCSFGDVIVKTVAVLHVILPVWIQLWWSTKYFSLHKVRSSILGETGNRQAVISYAQTHWGRAFYCREEPPRWNVNVLHRVYQTCTWAQYCTWCIHFLYNIEALQRARGLKFKHTVQKPLSWYVQRAADRDHAPPKISSRFTYAEWILEYEIETALDSKSTKNVGEMFLWNRKSRGYWNRNSVGRLPSVRPSI